MNDTSTYAARLAEVNSKLSDPIDRPVEEHEGWLFGEQVRVIEDDEREGVSEGEEGLLILETVGAAKHGNERVAFELLIDGYDSPLEVSPDNIEGT